jgi:hypothetical protein
MVNLREIALRPCSDQMSQSTGSPRYQHGVNANFIRGAHSDFSPVQWQGRRASSVENRPHNQTPKM